MTGEARGLDRWAAGHLAVGLLLFLVLPMLGLAGWCRSVATGWFEDWRAREREDLTLMLLNLRRTAFPATYGGDLLRRAADRYRRGMPLATAFTRLRSGDHPFLVLFFDGAGRRVMVPGFPGEFRALSEQVRRGLVASRKGETGAWLNRLSRQFFQHPKVLEDVAMAPWTMVPLQGRGRYSHAAWCTVGRAAGVATGGGGPGGVRQVLLLVKRDEAGEKALFDRRLQEFRGRIRASHSLDWFAGDDLDRLVREHDPGLVRGAVETVRRVLEGRHPGEEIEVQALGERGVAALRRQGGVPPDLGRRLALLTWGERAGWGVLALGVLGLGWSWWRGTLGRVSLQTVVGMGILGVTLPAMAVFATGAYRFGREAGERMRWQAHRQVESRLAGVDHGYEEMLRAIERAVARGAAHPAGLAETLVGSSWPGLRLDDVVSAAWVFDATGTAEWGSTGKLRNPERDRALVGALVRNIERLRQGFPTPERTGDPAVDYAFAQGQVRAMSRQMGRIASLGGFGRDFHVLIQPLGEGPFALRETRVSRRHPWRQRGTSDIVSVGARAGRGTTVPAGQPSRPGGMADAGSVGSGGRRYLVAMVVGSTSLKQVYLRAIGARRRGAAPMADGGPVGGFRVGLVGMGAGGPMWSRPERLLLDTRLQALCDRANRSQQAADGVVESGGGRSWLVTVLPCQRLTERLLVGAVPLGPVLAGAERLRATAVGVLLVLLGFAVGAAYLLAGFFARRLGGLERALERLRRREFEMGPVAEPDEFGALAAGLQRSAHTLSEIVSAVPVQKTLVFEGTMEAGAVRVEGRFQAAGLLGGDFSEVWRPEPGRLLLCLGDVAGSGVDASLLGARAKLGLRLVGERERDPAGMLGCLNGHLARVGGKGRHFALLVANWEEAGRRLSWANAGGCWPLHLRDGRPAWWQGSQPPLGSPTARDYASQSRDLQPGDVVVFFSNGWIKGLPVEAGQDAYEVFAGLVAASYQPDTDAFVRTLAGRISAKPGGGQEDDRTLLVLTMKGGGA
ncbi:MAG: serine/threonine-protein phosphatase [Candidatus Riflebacteria bacterium]|nr:serine/threonine-protein phosphatase [Candidatus Riflebacteria bacterium]